MQSLYEKGCDEVRDESGATDICAHCASEDKLQPALYFCFQCGPYGRYMCGDCTKQHRKFAHEHEIIYISDATEQARQNIDANEWGYEENQDQSGVIDICAHCASNYTIEPAGYFCFHCGPLGRYMCGKCNNQHKKFANAHNVRCLTKDATQESDANEWEYEEEEEVYEVTYSYEQSPNEICKNLLTKFAETHDVSSLTK